MRLFEYTILKINNIDDFKNLFDAIDINNILFINAFMSIDIRSELLRTDIVNTLNEHKLIFQLIPQVLIDELIVFEILTLNNCFNKTYQQYSGIKYSIINSNFYDICAFNIDYTNLNEFAISSELAFFDFIKLLNTKEIESYSLIRQWNYLGGINCFVDKANNYSIFNKDRFNAYSKLNINDYPSATGIGMDSKGLLLQGIMLNSATVKSIAIENPNQIPAYSYSNEILSDADKNSPLPPLFSRARLILINEIPSQIFISGTASINGEKTISEQDITAQTYKSIENINKLISKNNLNLHLEKSSIKQCNMEVEISNLRVYIKNIEDFQIVSDIISQSYKDIPVIYLNADICRDNLLVEIEGFANIIIS